MVNKLKYPRTELPTVMLYLWFLFFVLTPFYVLGSGLPQPSDWIIAILFTYIFLRGISPGTSLQQELVDKHRLFVIYVTVVNTIWFFFIDQSQEKRFPTFVHSFFYIFNFLTLRSALVLSKSFGKKFLIYTVYGVGLSMIIQAMLSFVTGATGGRTALFFNNPNQLGYYALLSGSLLIYAVRSVKVNIVFQLISYFSFFYLTLLSSSKAALVGSIILIFLAFVNQGLFNVKQLIVIVVVIASGSYFVLQSDIGSGLYGYSINRFQLIGVSRDDSYEGRGYDRILNEPEYLLVGAGEGGYQRFDTLLAAGEIHSSFGTLIFSYGIVGFFLFCRFLVNIFRGSTFFELLYFAPIFVYSITHQGLRDSLFWVFLGVVFLLNEEKISSRLRILRKRYLQKRMQRIQSRPFPGTPITES